MLLETNLGINLRYPYCRVPKLFCHETSPQFMVKLTDKKIKWAVEQVINKGESTEMVAAIYGASMRRIQQLVKYYRETGEYPMLDKKRRPKTHLTDDERQIIEDAYKASFLGARLLRYHIQKHYKRNISHNKIHQHLLEVELARPNLKKQKKS